MKRSVRIPALLVVVFTFTVVGFATVGFTVLSPPAWAQQPERFHLQRIARVVAEPIDEMSGIIKSRRRDNLYWVHNDSGDSPRIFAIDGQGRSVLPTYSKFTFYGDTAEAGKEQWQGFEVLYARNVDWEDIAADDNYLYLGDIGNNGNARRDLTIYMISEIDPTASTRSAVIKKLPVMYPEQTDFPPSSERYFDSESLFASDGKLYLITKHRGPGFFRPDFTPGAFLYRLDTAFDDRPNALTRVDSHPGILAATGADLAPDGTTLAVLSQDDLYLFRNPEGDQWFSTGEERRIPLSRAFKQAEGITWEDADTLLITNEQREIFRVEVAELPGSWDRGIE